MTVMYLYCWEYTLQNIRITIHCLLNLAEYHISGVATCINIPSLSENRKSSEYKKIDANSYILWLNHITYVKVSWLSFPSHQI